MAYLWVALLHMVMKEMKMGNDRYILIDLDNNEATITQKEAVKDLKPFSQT